MILAKSDQGFQSFLDLCYVMVHMVFTMVRQIENGLYRRRFALQWQISQLLKLLLRAFPINVFQEPFGNSPKTAGAFQGNLNQHLTLLSPGFFVQVMDLYNCESSTLASSGHLQAPKLCARRCARFPLGGERQNVDSK
eukprot:CAMPEP_0174332156 /NCGR_PEP_ID=MMETSP0810-20121108/18087_1 /TAXON_ID=73025 ORGANISM="Eutreptiella gymnastica-like, Strain CCMP1594" /NCGR_SAMPLE_ID=MMETSP0810 /ASSEMBLY_ACC=CAM_ASM_000659 /LENGTH=137 /DNA_ID=CAMNT_0015448425 /DNA_START=1 /DNA_END=414 /DNA_ORIENTATION=+